MKLWKELRNDVNSHNNFMSLYNDIMCFQNKRIVAHKIQVVRI